MRITSLEIEQFGIWEHLYLPKVSQGVNLFYGPNEAGKTTLMQFIRSSLYGCSNPERARYIQMDLYPKEDSPFASESLSAEKREKLTGIKGAISEKAAPADDSLRRWIGGALTVTDEFGKHRLERRYIRRSASLLDRQNALEAKSGFIVSGGLAAWSGRFFPIPGTEIAESLIVSGQDGARLSDHFIQTIVNNIDESTFNNVFAIGLDELQRLGTLNETDAAQMLYRLSVGMDRVSLIQVLHQLVEERNEIFDIKGKLGILDGLIARRDEFAQRSQEASINLREYASLLAERNGVEETLRQLEDKLAKHQRQERVYEIAHKLIAPWDERKTLKLTLSDYNAVTVVEKEGVAEAKKRASEIGQVKKSLADLKEDYRKERKSLKEILYNRKIWQNASRIEFLEGEIPHLEGLEKKKQQILLDRAAIQKELDQEEKRLKGAKQGKIILTPSVINSLTDLALGPDGASEQTVSADAKTDEEVLPDIREIEDYRISARGVSACRKHYRRVKEQKEAIAGRLKGITAKLDQELASRGQKSLEEAMTQTGELVVQLRRRAEIAKTLAGLEKIKKDLTRQNTYFVANQSLPYPVTIAIGIGVSLGGLIGVFSFLGKSFLEPEWGILGIIAAAVALFYKTTTEKKNYAKLEENQRQLALVTKRLEQVKSEAAAIDNRYPAPGQAVDIRLQKAETDLALYERLLPLDTKWKETSHHLKVLEKRLKKAKIALQEARRRWIGWLKTAGLSAELKPSHIRAMIERVDYADSLRQQLDNKTKELDLIAREKKGITDLIARILLDTGTILPAEKTPIQQITHLRQLLDEVRLARKNRSESVKRLNALLKERNRILNQIRRMENDLADFLDVFDAKSVDHLEKLADRYQDHQALLAQLQTLEEKITAGIGEFCPESEISEILDDETVRANLKTLMTNAQERIKNLTEEQKEKTLLAGRLSEQLENLAHRKDAVGYQFEKAALNLRIGEMGRLWQSRAVACKMMDDIRKAYEKERQPETLQEASRLLRRLTDGLYVKIWTPLGEDVLYVDTQDGKTLEVSSLSRGTREQLFIAIRLALAISFEKHGVSLPLILDDVLVNFDNHRAAAAARVLHEFAESGRQIFLFTCHQHICRTFLDLDTPVYILPEKKDQVKRFRVILPPSMEEKGGKKESAVLVKKDDENQPEEDNEPSPSITVISDDEDVGISSTQLAELPDLEDVIVPATVKKVSEKTSEIETPSPKTSASSAPSNSQAASFNNSEEDLSENRKENREEKNQEKNGGEDEKDEKDLKSEKIDAPMSETPSVPSESIASDLPESDSETELHLSTDDSEISEFEPIVSTSALSEPMEDEGNQISILSEEETVHPSSNDEIKSSEVSLSEDVLVTASEELEIETVPPAGKTVSVNNSEEEVSPEVSSGQGASQEMIPLLNGEDVIPNTSDLENSPSVVLESETIPEQPSEEENPRDNSIQFSQWNDYFRPDRENTPNEAENEITEEKEPEKEEESEFIKNYFVRESDEAFFAEKNAEQEKTSDEESSPQEE